VVAIYRSAGIGPAMQKFMALAGLRGGGPPPPPPPQGEPTPEQREAVANMQRNMDFWLGHSFQAIADYEPDFEALKKSPVRIVSAVGDESRGQLAHEGGLRLAKLLGSEAGVFPRADGGVDRAVTTCSVGATCGVQFAATEGPPERCPICEDERQYVGWSGQRWTTLDDRRKEHRNQVRDDCGLTGIGTEPSFAIA